MRKGLVAFINLSGSVNNRILPDQQNSRQMKEKKVTIKGVY